MSFPVPGPAEIERLEQLLRQLGASEEDLVAARAAHAHGALALDLTLRAGADPLDLDAAAAQLRTPAEQVARMWQAMGFADVPARRMPAALVEAQAVLSGGVDKWIGEDIAIGIARVVGASGSRLAEAVVDAFRIGFEVPELSAGTQYTDVVESYLSLTRELLPSFERLVAEVFRAHLVRVAGSAWMPAEDGATTRRDLAIGFVDLVGYTALARTLGPAELAAMLNQFEDEVGSALARHGARPVKSLGDGVMFVADSAAAGCAAGLELAAAFAGAADVPPVRVGLAYGGVLSLYGDYFGDVVNLAARLVALANPGTVVVSDAVATAAPYSFERLPPRALKGFGTPTGVYRLLRPEDPPKS